jgi:exopolysaccharide biosynthesis polyprenyl glycosylphosphotransferase
MVDRIGRIPLHLSQRKILVATIDLAIVNGFLLIRLVRDLGEPLTLSAFFSHIHWYVTLSVIWLLAATAGDNYDSRRWPRRTIAVIGILKAWILTAVIYVFLPLLSPPLPATRITVLGGIAATGVALAAWRLLYAVFARHPTFRRRAIVAGAGWAGRTIVGAIREHDPGYEVVGFVDDAPEKQGTTVQGVPVLGSSKCLESLIEEHEVTDVVLSITHAIGSDLVRALLRCFERGVRILPMPILFEQVTGRVPVEHIGDRWLVALPISGDAKIFYSFTKRAIDIGVSLVGLAILAPFFPLIALAIRLDSPGPIFYRPERLGFRGAPFKLWKFRTMVADADRVGDPTFTSSNDSRITRIGQILRTTHVDELPQFINILRGDMSLVGPRPERHVPEFEEKIPFYRLRTAVKPGTAGWALARQGYAEGEEGTLVKLQYDLYFIKHRSLYLDFIILLRTAVDMVFMRGR